MSKDPEAEIRLLKTLSHHHGKARAISMPALFHAVFDREMGDKINGTRALRDLVTKLRREGIPICSTADQNGGGYYLASAGSDLEDYCRKLKIQALKKLTIVAKLQNRALPELVGQISINLARDEKI